MHRVLAVALCAAACGSSSTPTTTPTTTPPPDPQPSGERPGLLGKPVWDGPLTDPMALRSLERVRTALNDRPPVLQGADPRMWLGPVQGWIETRVKLTREVSADAGALNTDADPRMKLLAAVVISVASDDFVTDLLSIEPPPEFASADQADVVKQAFHESLEKQAAPLTAATRAMLQKCVAAAPLAPEPMRVWETFCKERDASLAELEARVAARDAKPKAKPQPKPPALFADCDTKEVRHVDLEAPPPDMKVKPVVAYIYDRATDLKAAEAEKLEQAVAAKLGINVGMPVVDAKEMSAARDLAGKKKLHAKGPVCAQAPPLPAIVAYKRKHLIIGEVEKTCIWKNNAEKCGLLVRYERAGSDDGTGLPQPMFARVANTNASLDDLIAAADQLAPDDTVADLLAGGSSDSSIFFDLANYSDEDPWLRLASTLDDDTRTRIAACTDGAGSFDLSFTISPVGKTQKVSVTPVTAPAAGSKLADCVKKALDATPWPCTSNGKPAKVAVRMCVAPKPAS